MQSSPMADLNMMVIAGYPDLWMRSAHAVLPAGRLDRCSKKPHVKVTGGLPPETTDTALTPGKCACHPVMPADTTTHLKEG
jgi:hypothetical protein